MRRRVPLALDEREYKADGTSRDQSSLPLPHDSAARMCEPNTRANTTDHWTRPAASYKPPLALPGGGRPPRGPRPSDVICHTRTRTPPPQPLRFQTQDVVGADGTVEALQSQLADGLHLYQLFHHSQQAQRNEDLAGLGLAAETGGEVSDGADRSVVPATLEADGADRGVALGDADAEAELEPSLVPSDDQLCHAVPHRERHANRPFLRIRYGHRVIEKDHHAVAGEARVPSWARISLPISAWYSRRTPITSSGSVISAKAVKPRRSRKATVISRRWVLRGSSAPPATISSASWGEKKRLSRPRLSSWAS